LTNTAFAKLGGLAIGVSLVDGASPGWTWHGELKSGLPRDGQPCRLTQSYMIHGESGDLSAWSQSDPA